MSAGTGAGDGAVGRAAEERAGALAGAAVDGMGPTRAPGAVGSRDARRIALPEHVEWRRMNPVTPLLEGWKVITAILAFATIQNLDELVQAWNYVNEHGFSLASGIVRWVLLGILVLLLVMAGALFLSWWLRSYAVDRDAVYLRSGILVRQLRTARLPRIQAVDVVHPLLGRILGLGQLKVEVAGGGDSRVIIGYLRTAELEELRDRILDLAAGAQEEETSGTRTGARAGAAPATEPGAEAPAEGAGAAGAAGSTGADAAETSGTGRADAGAAAPSSPRTGAPLGFEDAAAAGRLVGTRTEEHPLYSVDTGVLLRSTLRSGQFLFLLVFTILVVGGMVLAIVLEHTEVTLAAILPMLAAPVAFIGTVWGRFNHGWGYRAAATPAGIRMRFGLTADTSSTLPPGRVHGVSLEQGILWRGPDWWRVETAVAGRTSVEASNSGSIEETGENVLLPVGDRDTAERALWLVVPDLGVPDPDALLDAALTGTEDEGVGNQELPVDDPRRGFMRVSPRGRIFSPLGWRREAIALTGTCVVLRLGRWNRRVAVIPYERIQSISVKEGTFARRRGLARLTLDLVAHEVPSQISNLDAALAAEIERVLSERALRRRRQERLDRWLERAAAPSAPAARAEVG